MAIMESWFFHPRMVHVPLALAVLMPVITTALLVSCWRGWLPRRVWLIAIALQLVLVSSGVVALRTGESDEDRVERAVAERYIEQHEEAAEGFVLAGAAVLVLMIVAALLGPRRASPAVASLATIGTLIVLALAYRTGEAGAALIYRHGAAQAFIDNGTSTSPARQVTRRGKEDEDD